jgi:serine/threonine protein kinase
MSELIGQTLGQYQITAVLGAGGMATVYRAHQLSIKRDVAIKVIQSKLARNPDFVKRFEREAQTVASLDHPHILKVFDFGQQGDLIYLVMELKTGGTLAELIASNQLSLDSIAVLLTQIASALDYAHLRGIIHRDLKPQNVLLDEQGNAVLNDFGIAKLIQPDYTSLTQTGAAMGTPAYMSPEQWHGHVIDARSDIYALGIMLYEMLAGQVPFRAETPASIMFAHLQQNPPLLRELRPTLPPYLDPVIQIALAKNPDERFQFARALADAFRDAINGKPFVIPEKSPVLSTSGSIPVAPISRRGSSLLLIIAGVLIAVLVIGGLLRTSQRNNDSTPTSPAVNVITTTVTQVAAALATTTELSTTETPILASPTQSATSTPTVTLTASPTITASFTPSQVTTVTLDLVQIAASLDTQATATMIVIQTLTATGWTPTSTVISTPMPNITASIEAFLTLRAAPTGTAQSQIDATNTATHTLTYTNTSEPTLAFQSPTLIAQLPTYTLLPPQTVAPIYVVVTATPISQPLVSFTMIPTIVPISTEMPRASNKPCFNGWETRLFIGATTRVITVPSGGKSRKLYAVPDRGTAALCSASRDIYIMTVLDGPSCAIGGTTWWKVSFSKNGSLCEGWMAESGPDYDNGNGQWAYFLQ